MKIQTVVIRDKYQMTIPDKIREELSWVRPNTAIEVTWSDDKIILQPQRGTVNWKIIGRAVKAARTEKTKTSLADWIIRDRETHLRQGYGG